MFRRKEEGLFDTDVLERSDEMESINIINQAANAPTSGFTSVSASVPSAPSAPPAARPSAAPAPAASASTPTPAPVAPAPASSFRPVQTASQAANEAPRPRPAAETKPVVPVVSSLQQNSKPAARILTVGNDILLKGEIATCDRLVIQGQVEATLNDVNTVELAEIGTFKGVANVVDALISGTFEGDLVCTGKLIIFASGKVRGKITYGEIEIERGGELTGEIKTVSAQSPKAVRREAA